MARRSTTKLQRDDQRFPVRIRVAVPPHGFGTKGDAMDAWLRAYVGRDGFASHGATRFDAHAAHFYFSDAGRAAEFVKEFGLKRPVGCRP